MGHALVANPRVAGVAFTGSTAAARRIALALLEDETRPLVPLIAETGGVNAMLVDSTALPEQVVADVITSAFLSAGQRCSALRLLCLHEEIAEDTLRMLVGAMDELVIGDPADPATDVGPVIDAAAQHTLEAHRERWRGHVVHACSLPPAGSRGTFVPPTLIRLERHRRPRPGGVRSDPARHHLEIGGDGGDAAPGDGVRLRSDPGRAQPHRRRGRRRAPPAPRSAISTSTAR